ncbi:MAG: DNA-directed RNA polymerase subunit alpha [Acholeplasmatales bacterium]|jgi:DNA-directed RNA polymerase subunit alpha|nr:DNA-directed RNA polymerase subunit alpha [Acholeplasmatales bacterium]
MNNLKFKLPHVNSERTNENTYSLTFEPLDRGYGDTLGNSLRRVLLASIPGVAIVGVVIEGVSNEFSTIDGVTEDVMGIILNLKKVILSSSSDDENIEESVRLVAYGPKNVTASDFELPNNLKAVNKDLHIATLSENAKLDMTVLVKKGVGYVSANENKKYKQGRDIDFIAIDSLYSPIVRCTYKVDSLREGGNRLILDVESNGSIDSVEAVYTATQMLKDYYSSLSNSFDSISKSPQSGSWVDELLEKEEEVEPDANLPIAKLNIQLRTYNALKRAGLETVESILNTPVEELRKINRIGNKAFKDIRGALDELGYKYASDFEFDDIPDEDGE